MAGTANHELVDELFEQERKARLGGDSRSLQQIHQQIMSQCHTDEEVIAALKALSNKRAQDPHCIKTLIHQLYQSNRPIEFFYSLLSEVIEAKIYLEEERLCVAEHIKLMHGNNIRAAYDVIKDIPIETFTSINERLRNSFLFEQLRLALLLRRFSEAELIGRRVRRSYLNNEEKPVFYNYMVLLRIGTKAYLSAARAYLELNSFNPDRRAIALGSFFCLLSSCLTENRNVLSEKRELLTEFERNERNDSLMRSFVVKFRSNLILEFSELRGEILAHLKTFDADVTEAMVSAYSEELKCSIIEHNFEVVKKYVSMINLRHLHEILGLTEDELVSFASSMVNEKYDTTIRINQVDGLVDFGKKTWNTSVDELLDKVVSASNLIHQDSITN